MNIPTVKFLWKGYCSKLDANMSVAIADSHANPFNDFREDRELLAVTIFSVSDVEITSFVVEVAKKDLLKQVESGQLITKLEEIAIELMYNVAVDQRKTLVSKELH